MNAESVDPLPLLLQLDAGIALFLPVLSEANNVVDASVLWANAKAESAWGNSVGSLASAMAAHFDEWLDAANTAWQGSATKRLIEADPQRVGWTRAESTLTRIDRYLAEVIVDRSADQDLIDRLAALDRRYRNLLVELPVTVFVARADRDELEFVSPNATELTGRPLSELNTRSSLRAIVHPDDVAQLDEMASVLIHANEAAAAGRILRPDGSVRWIEARVTLDGVVAEGVRRLLLTGSDVTDRRAAEQEAQQRERVEALARTAGAFSHEFSSLLQVISGNLERLHSSVETPADAVGQSLAAVARAGSLVNGLMSFASGRPGAAEAVSASALCQSMHTVFRGRLPQAVGLTLDVADTVPDVLIAPDALSVVMLQLLDNAAASITDSGSVRIEVSERSQARCHLAHRAEPRSWVCITVADDGCGIEADRLLKVWEPFYTSRSGIAARGAGLGLSIAHGVIHQYDGHLTLDSSPNIGTTVSLYLPAVDG